MSIKFPKFVGRDRQLSAIRNHIETGRQTVVVNIAGDGGVGKTTILGKVKEIYESQPQILITDVIDFSQTVHQVQSWIIEQIAKVQPDGFRSYDVKKQEIELLDSGVRFFREREMIEAFLHDYNLMAQDYRFILLFDTIELVQETPLLRFIIETVAKLRNTVFILAGRRNNDSILKERLNDNFGPGQVLTLALEGFTENEADLYFKETRDLPRLKTVSEKIRKNIHLLSEGKPIMIALALDWLDRGIPLMPEITRLNPEKLQEDRRSCTEEWLRLRPKFEHALMDGIRKLGSPLDRIILNMAHLNKRFNQDILEFFFFENADDGKRQAEVDRTMAQLQTLPFVKYISKDYFVLHDEMIRLVQTYVLNSEEDPDRKIRRELSITACKYYDRKLKDLTRPEQRVDKVEYWSYCVERMYYKLYADFVVGYFDFEELFEHLVDDQRPELAALAVKFLREFRDEPEYSKLLASFVDGYYEGGVLLSQQKFDEAKGVLSAGEQRFRQQIEKLNPAEAHLLDQRLSERFYLVYHQLGFCFRWLGDWERAIENYRESLKHTLESVQKLGDSSPVISDEKKSLLAQMAETLNSMANVYRFTGDFHEARLLCQTSIFLRQTWQSDQVAVSKYVMAMILWQMGSTAESVGYLREAEQICSPENEILQALIAKYQAYIYFHAGLPEKTIPLLQKAEAVLRRRGHYSELADALNLLSRVYREQPTSVQEILNGLDPMLEAERFTSEAEQLAYGSGDEYRQAECHLTQALHYLHWSRLDQAHGEDHRQKALAHWDKGVKLAENRYYQLWSLFCQVRGDIAFESAQPDYDLAFAQYIQQCRLATRFKRAVYERAVDRVTTRLSKLRQQPDLAERYISNVLYGWHQHAELRIETPRDVPFEWRRFKYSEVITEMSLIRDTIDEEKKLARFRLDYNRAMKRGEWRDAIEFGDKIIGLLSFHHDPNRADVVLDQFRAVYHMGDLAKSRQLARTVLQIGRELQVPRLTGEAYLALAAVLWDTTNTAEAAEYLNQAESAFRQINDEVGLYKIRRLRSHILYRTGFFEEPLAELQEIAKFFEQHNLNSELADVWNLMSRIYRTHPRHPDFEQAHRYAKQALEKAECAEDAYRKAECQLSLALLALQRGEYEQVLEMCRTVVVSSETHLLRGLYEGVRGAALFELGLAATDKQSQLQRWDEAFEAFVLELVEITKSKLASLPRALDKLYASLMRLPAESVEKYAEQIKKAWRRQQLEQEFPMVNRIADEAKQYRPFIQIKQR